MLTEGSIRAGHVSHADDCPATRAAYGRATMDPLADLSKAHHKGSTSSTQGNADIASSGCTEFEDKNMCFYSPVQVLSTLVRQENASSACGFFLHIPRTLKVCGVSRITNSRIWLQLESRFNSTTLIPACETACGLRQLSTRKTAWVFTSPHTAPPTPRTPHGVYY